MSSPCSVRFPILRNVSRPIVGARPPRILRTPLPEKRTSKRPSHSVLAYEQKEDEMPLFMDVHQTLPGGATFDGVKGGARG
jgi:hypothetical protein